MRFQLDEILTIILTMVLLLFLPHSGCAQNLLFQYGPLFGAYATPFEHSSFPSTSPWYGGSYLQSPYVGYAGWSLYGTYIPYYSYTLPPEIYHEPSAHKGV